MLGSNFLALLRLVSLASCLKINFIMQILNTPPLSPAAFFIEKQKVEKLYRNSYIHGPQQNSLKISQWI